METEKEKIPATKKEIPGSWLALKVTANLMILLGLFFITAFLVDYPPGDVHVDAFMCETAGRWRDKYGNDPDLQVAFIDIKFHKEPNLFVEGEGVVISPVGINLHNAQKILEIESYPPFLRKLGVEGITCLSWKYAGKVNQDLRYTALALVRRGKKKIPELPENPTYNSLPQDLQQEALATAEDIEEHNLHECAEFPRWVKSVAGDPPYTMQFLRIARAIGENIVENDDSKNADDICAAIREKKFSLHRAHVLAVMAARQMKIPAFGFASASPKKIYLVGIYTDQAGWLLIDMEYNKEGYFTGGPVLLTKTPILSRFKGGRHGFWFPQAAAYTKMDWNEIASLSRTSWMGKLSDGPANTTQAKSFHFSEICK